MRKLTGVVSACLLMVSLSACEEEIFRDRPLFEEPAAGAMGFLGYYDEAEGLTSCGNCHIGVQRQWDETAHADAWEGLQASGHAQAFCEGCHTVSELGNEVSEPAGWNVVPEDRYHDVQCESCHGPGLTHVQEPGSFQPLAELSVGVDLTTGCGECHQGTHHPFAEEWSQSGHAVVGFAANRGPDQGGCNGCHSGNGALDRWGFEAEYVEKDAAAAGDPVAITCGVCHDPHGSDNAAQLRFPIDTPDLERNLCAQCHNRRTVPDPNSSHGLHPHSPEAALLEGDVGWWPPGLTVDRGEIIATHGSEANPNYCTTCHVNSFEINDAETGEFVFNATGHLFGAIPCVDATGIPTAGDCGLSVAERSFEGCTASGCHGTPEVAFSALSTASLRLQTLAEELHDLLAQVDPNLEDAGGEIDAANPTFTVAEGAFFNYALAEFGGTDRPDPLLAYSGSATHNPFLTEQLLISSIAAVEDEYGVSASPTLDLRPLLPGS